MTFFLHLSAATVTTMASLTSETPSTTSWSKPITSTDAQPKENRRLAAEAELNTTLIGNKSAVIVTVSTTEIESALIR